MPGAGLPGITALDVSLLALGILTWGTLKQRAWAWWGGPAYWGWLVAATVASLAATEYLDLLGLLDLPARELEFLDGVPLQGAHLAAFLGLIFALPIGWLIACKKYFGRDPDCRSV